MDTTVIKTLVSSLNNKWFKDKKTFFEFETLLWLDKNQNSKELKNYNFLNYCWDSIIENYIPNTEATFKPEHLKLTIDTKDIALKIVSLIDKEIKGKSHPTIKYNIVCTSIDVIKYTIQNLINAVSGDEHKIVLNNFLINIEKMINIKFSEIKEEADELSQLNKNERKLSIEMCTRIADFKLGNKRLVTHVRMKKTKDKLTEKHGITEGEALFEIFNPDDNRLPRTDVFMESWNRSDIYLLLNELEAFFYGIISLSNIEEKISLFYKENDNFLFTNYGPWHSQKKELYLKRYPKRLSEIQELVSSLSGR